MKQTIKCYQCNKLLTKDEIALSKKLLGRQTIQLLCIDCLASFLDTEPEVLAERIEQFKDDGCALFK